MFRSLAQYPILLSGTSRALAIAPASLCRPFTSQSHPKRAAPAPKRPAIVASLDQTLVAAMAITSPLKEPEEVKPGDPQPGGAADVSPFPGFVAPLADVELILPPWAGKDKGAKVAPLEAADVAAWQPDVFRPRYHVQPEKGWLNDPNGPVYIDGEYHIFFQHNGEAAKWQWEKISWGHCVSKDLVHWESRPVALSPTPGTYDEDGIFSGCCVTHNDTPVLVYTGVQRALRNGAHPVTSKGGTDPYCETQCLATRQPDGSFQKHPANPVIAGPPSGLKVTGFRDPHVWRESDGSYRMLLGSGIEGVGGTALLYKSEELVTWGYVGQLCTGVESESGKMWECPMFTKVGRWHVLCVSPDRPSNPCLYWVGTFADDKFTPHTGPHKLDLGNVVYAPILGKDGPKGRTLLWSWLQELRDVDTCLKAGYAGCLAIPRVLSTTESGDLYQEPIEELELLRGRKLISELQPQALSSKRKPRAHSVRTDSLELKVEFERGSANVVGVELFEPATLPPTPTQLPPHDNEPWDWHGATTPKAHEPHEVLELPVGLPVVTTVVEPHEKPERPDGVLIAYDYSKEWLEVRRWQPSSEPDAEPGAGLLVTVGGTQLTLEEGESLKLRVFLDGSAIEVFANSRACLTTRVYRSLAGLTFVSKEGTAKLVSAEAWEMNPAYGKH